MSRRCEVLSDGAWPSGDQRTAGTLRVDLPSLSERLGAEFQPGSDDLGPFRQIGLRLPSGRLVLLIRYDAEPAAGPTVWIDAEDDPFSAVGELCDCLRLGAAEVEWISIDRAPPTTETHLLRDLLAGLLERGRDAASAARARTPATSEERDFDRGVAMGYYQVLSYTLGQLEAFGIERRRVGWPEDVDLESELLS